MMQFNCEWALYCFRASGLSGWWIRSIAQVQKLALTDRHVQNFALNNIKKKTNYSTWRICLNTCAPFFLLLFSFFKSPCPLFPPDPSQIAQFHSGDVNGCPFVLLRVTIDLKHNSSTHMAGGQEAFVSKCRSIHFKAWPIHTFSLVKFHKQNIR